MIPKIKGTKNNNFTLPDEAAVKVLPVNYQTSECEKITFFVSENIKEF